MDERHLMFNMDNHKTLGLRGSNMVKYSDVVGGSDGFTMVLWLRGGVDAKLKQLFLNFKNWDRNYPVLNLLENLDGVSYCTQAHAWMDNAICEGWLGESRTVYRDANNYTRYLFIDNYQAISRRKISTVHCLPLTQRLNFCHVVQRIWWILQVQWSTESGERQSQLHGCRNIESYRN